MSDHQANYTSPGSSNWTVPQAVKLITTMYLIGGGGGSDTPSNAGGGGGGAYLDKTNISTSPGSSWSFVVGAGGGSGSNGTASNWNSGQYIAGGGLASSGSTGGSGGTVSGSGTPTDSTSGGDGGAGCDTTGCACDNCTCDQTCNGTTCDDPPTCSSYSCTGYSCNGVYHCTSSHVSSCASLGGGGSSGTLGGKGNGSSASCGGGSCCDTCCDVSCGDGARGSAPASPGGDGGNGGADGTAYGGGAGGGGHSGADGLVRIEWNAGNLVITQQPSNTAAGATISPAITVEVRYADDNSVATGYTGSVNVSIYTNPGGGTLSGTTSQTVVSGVVTFNNLSINNAGTGYVLLFTTGTFDVNGAFSNPFNITSGASSVYSVYALNRPVLESVFKLSQLRPARSFIK